MIAAWRRGSLLAAGLLASSSGCAGPGAEGASEAVPIREEYPDKIVYTIERNVDVQALDAHCAARGGTFNECGSPCPAGEVCAAVCAYTCELETTGAGSGSRMRAPEGFAVSPWADGVRGARDLSTPDRLGNLWVTRPDAGAITLLELDAEGGLERATDILNDLAMPCSLALEPSEQLDLYYATNAGIFRARLYSDAPIERVADLPAGGAARGLLFGPDGRLYVSVGASCWDEPGGNPGTGPGGIWALDRDGGAMEQVATGLRKPGFLAIHPVTGDIWLTEQSRASPALSDEVNVLVPGASYGWPWCYGRSQRDPTTAPPKSDYCAEQSRRARLLIHASYDPVGLAFVPDDGWPEWMWHDLLVSNHSPGDFLLDGPRGEACAPVVIAFQLTEYGELRAMKPFLCVDPPSTDEAGAEEASGVHAADIVTMPGGILYVASRERGVCRVMRRAQAEAASP